MLTATQPQPYAHVQPRRALDALGTRYFLAPKDADNRDLNQTTLGLRSGWLEPRWSGQRPQQVPAGEALQPAVADPARWLQGLEDHLDVLANPHESPRAWIVRDLRVTPPVVSTDSARLYPMLMSLVFPTDRWIDMRRSAWVEDDGLKQLAPDGGLRLDEGDPEVETCRVVRYEPQRVEIDVLLTSPGFVVLSDMYYPGWELHVETGGESQPAAIFRTNRVMRGALLTPGKHTLVYRYRPLSFYCGLAISLLAWTTVLVLVVAKRR
jgi:hypothetical protein